MLLPPGLLIYAVQNIFPQILCWMGYCNAPLFRWMFKLVMIAPCGNQYPPIVLEHFNDFSRFQL